MQINPLKSIIAFLKEIKFSIHSFNCALKIFHVNTETKNFAGESHYSFSLKEKKTSLLIYKYFVRINQHKLSLKIYILQIYLTFTQKTNVMKKLFVIMCLSSFLFGFSQEKETTDFKRNELKGNALFLVLGAGEFTYERLLNEESGVGISLFFNYDDEFDTKFSLTPYYRFYFGKKPAAGFFVEGFGMLNTYQYTEYSNDVNPDPTINSKEIKNTDFALGFGLGAKWITKKGFLFEINSGIGRNLFNGKNNDDYEIVDRGGFTVGYRF